MAGKDDNKTREQGGTGIVGRNISQEMRESFIDYAMSVITDRALPDVRDGLKPVHRRILYTMHRLGLTPGSRFRKSALVVGDVLGKFHPHGDQSVYDAMVKMAQEFSMRYPLVLGQGNFGSIDGDPAAAMRYTESKMSRVAESLLGDLDKDTIDWRPNYDGTLREPSVLPATVPNILLNGTLGIAVGMATSIPPHNLGEVSNALTHLIDNPDATVEDLMEFVTGPDFPTGAVAFDKKALLHAYSTGKGGVVVRGQAEIVEGKKGRLPNRHHIHTVPRQQGRPHHAHRRPGARQKAGGRARAARRVQQGHPRGRGPQGRRAPAEGAQLPVQAHCARGHVPF